MEKSKKQVTYINVRCVCCGKSCLTGEGTKQNPYMAKDIIFTVQGPYSCACCGHILIKNPFKNSQIQIDGSSTLRGGIKQQSTSNFANRALRFVGQKFFSDKNKY